MTLKKATEVFEAWAKEGKDIGMEKNHAQSVQYMLKQIPSSILVKIQNFLMAEGWQ